MRMDGEVFLRGFPLTTVGYERRLRRSNAEPRFFVPRLRCSSDPNVLGTPIMFKVHMDAGLSGTPEDNRDVRPKARFS